MVAFANKAMQLTEDILRSAESLIRSVCHDKDGWRFDECEPIENDAWDADHILVYRRNDYVTCYVGLRQGTPIYVLQRIE
jgi:hypothetical protein